MAKASPGRNFYQGIKNKQMMEDTKQPSKLIAIYGRVSTSNQENEGTIETQMSAVKEHARKKNCVIVQEYTDEGWSGDSLVRPNLDRLRVDAKKKLWQAVLVYDPDRLARRYSYQELIMDELREAGIEVMFVTVAAPQNSEDKILHGVRGLFAEYERAKISERFRLGKLRKVKEGHVLVSEPPYGYTYTPKNDRTHGYYEINEAEAEVVRLIFAWVADEGLTLRRVVRRLHQSAIKPRESPRGVWATSTLSHLLRNKCYIGEARWGSSYAVVPENPHNKEKYRKTRKSSRRMKPEAEWLTIPVPAIIDRDLFLRARKRVEMNFALCQRNTKNEYLLAGRIWCDCGKRRAGEGPQHGKHLYYRCNDRVSRFPLPRVCREWGIDARIADQLVWQKVAELMRSPELMERQLSRWIEGKQRDVRSISNDIPALEKEIRKQQEHEDRYNKAYGAGLFTVEQLKQYTGPIKERIAALESQIAKGLREKGENAIFAIPSKEELQGFVTDAARALEHLEFGQKRAIIGQVVERVIGAKGKLQVYGHIPIQSKVELFANDRYRVNTNQPAEGSGNGKAIPFRFAVALPPPRFIIDPKFRRTPNRRHSRDSI